VELILLLNQKKCIRVIFDTTLFTIMQGRDNDREEFSSSTWCLYRVAHVFFFKIILFSVVEKCAVIIYQDDEL